MKRFIPYLLYIFIFFSGNNCSKKDAFDSQSELTNRKIREIITSANTTCGSENPEQSLQWLKEIITKAEEDKQTMKYQGNYMGKIFLTSYHNQPVFYVSMSLGSGGIASYIYDCIGKNVSIEAGDVGFEQEVEKEH